jgi:hypothetical protein
VSDEVRWWKNGDHPDDHIRERIDDETGVPYLSEGKAVKRWVNYEGRGYELCDVCGAPMNAHGRLGGPQRGKIVHPGDYVSADAKTVRHPDPVAEAIASAQEEAE